MNAIRKALYSLVALFFVAGTLAGCAHPLKKMHDASWVLSEIDEHVDDLDLKLTEAQKAKYEDFKGAVAAYINDRKAHTDKAIVAYRGGASGEAKDLTAAFAALKASAESRKGAAVAVIEKGEAFYASLDAAQRTKVTDKVTKKVNRVERWMK